MSASEEPKLAEPSPAPPIAETDAPEVDAPAAIPDPEEDAAAFVPPSAEGEAAPPVEAPPAPQRSTSSPVKKIARPAKARASLPGKSKKGGEGDSKSFQVGDIVLARLKGYPPWPSRVADINDLSAKVLASRPGKSPNIYCVQYFPAGDFSWLQSKEMQPLSSNDIEAYLAEPHRKATGGLREAYTTAQDPTDWDLVQAKARTAREEAEAAVMDDVDELDEEEEEGVTGGKRKRTASEKKEKKKKVKTAKKKAAAEDPESEADAPAPKSKGKTPAKSKTQPTTKSESKVDAADDETADPKAKPPTAECTMVKTWRHKLQRAFLSKTVPPVAEMSEYDDIFKAIEDHKSMTVEALQYSKIGKVMKKIATLEGVPRNDELNITGRAQKLMHEWGRSIPGGARASGAAEDGAEEGESKEVVEAETKNEVAEGAGANGDKMELDA